MISPPRSGTPNPATGASYGASATKIATALRRVARSRTTQRVLAGCAQLVLLFSLLLSLQLLLDLALNLERPVRLAFRILESLLYLYLINRWIAAPLRKHWDPEATARVLQNHFPNLGSRLVSSLQLDCSLPAGSGISSSLIQTLSLRSLSELQSCPLPTVTPTKPLVYRILLALAVGSILIGSILQTWPASQLLLKRYVLLAVPLPTATRIIQTSGDQSVPRGESLRLFATIEGVSVPQGTVTLRFAEGGQRELAIFPDPEAPGHYSIHHGPINDPFTYSFRINDGTSASYRVKIFDLPLVIETRWTTTPPAYTALPTRQQTGGRLEPFIGSQLSLEAVANHPLAKAELLTLPLQDRYPLTINPRDPTQVSGQITIENPNLSGLSILLTSTDGVTSGSNVIYPLRPRLDLPPVVNLTLPTQEIQTLVPEASFTIAGTASDDFGITESVLVFSLARPNKQREVLERSLSLDSEGAFNLQVSPRELFPRAAPGDSLAFSVKITDNNPQPSLGISQTGERLLRLVTRAEKQAELLDKLDQNAEMIETLSREQQDIRSSLGDVLSPR
ncbi:MAG: hypothetical protein ACFCU4_05030 [Puniceicoccaceae bacterium]